MHALVEIRQIVFACPFRNLTLVPIRSTVAVRTIPIVFLEKLLVLALEVDFQNDAFDRGALIA